MDIPSTLEELEYYFDRVLTLLEKWSWVYEDRTTDILLSGALNSEYLDFIEKLDNYTLNQLPSGLIKEYWPAELIHFVEECARLSLLIPSYNSDNSSALEISGKLKKCTSVKKIHEINRLATCILKHCAEHDISRVYDVGSGLGYVDRVLTTYGGLSVIGIESDGSKISTATKMNKELLEPEKFSNISYIESRLDNNTLDNVCQLLGHYEDKGCLTGLHACGDLSAITLRLFLSLKRVTSLILMSCCYHKMNDISSFPVSKILNNKLTSGKRKLINTTLLRLASESTKERWSTETEEAHNAHAFSVLSRAVVQSFLVENKMKATRRKRRCVTKQHNAQWDQYIAIWLERHTVTDENHVEVSKESLSNELNDYWTNYSHLMKRIEGFTALQVCLQGVAECLLIVDRLSFLLESEQISSATAVRITNPSISPRSIALVANKHS